MKKITNGTIWPVTAFCLTVAGVCTSNISNYDIWWHLNLGREIFNKKQIVFPDTFSYTFFGSSQFNGEWLANLTLYLTHILGGVWGLIFLKTLLLLITFYNLYNILKIKIESPQNLKLLAIITTLLIVLISIRFRLLIRPFLFSYVCFSFFLSILYRYDLLESKKHLLWLILIEILWANLSSGFIFGPILTAIFLIGRIPSKGFDKNLFIIFLLVALSSFASPEYWKPYLLILHNIFNIIPIPLDASSSMVGEHQPLSPQLLWGSGVRYTLGFQLLVTCSLLYFIFMRGWRNYTDLILFITFLIPTFGMIRMIDFFSLAACGFAISPVAFFYQKLFGSLSLVEKTINRLFAAVILFCGVGLVFYFNIFTFGAGINDRYAPRSATDWLDKKEIKGRIFNSYPFGGYIPWALPGRKVFIDGRTNHLYPKQFHQDYFRIIHEPNIWAEAENKWDFTVSVLEYDTLSGGRHYPRHLKDNDRWVPVYWDDICVIYLKRIPEHDSIINQYEYQIARPNFFDFSYLKELEQSIPSKRIITMLKEDIDRHPDNQEIRLALAYYYNSLNFLYYSQLIEKELTESLKILPNLAMEHSALGFLYFHKGDKAKAKSQATKALELDPADSVALLLMEKLGSPAP